MRRARLPLLLGVALLALTGCSDLGDPYVPAPLEPPPPEFTVLWGDDVEPILQANCHGCHFPEMSVYANIVGVEAVGYGGPFRVAAGDTANSVLFQKISGNPAYGAQMPFGGALLPEQVTAIGTWIAEGALEN